VKIQAFFIKLADNWPYKLSSIAAAVILYFSYQILSLDSKSFSVPLSVREYGSFTLVDQAPRFVRVTVRGVPEQLTSIQKSDIKAYIDTSFVSVSGLNSLPVHLELNEYFTLMEPLDIQVKPNMLSLAFEQNTYRWVPVKPLFSGSVPDGYELASWRLEPEYIKISGPVSAVESAAEVFTGGIDLRNKKADFKQTIKLETGSKKIRLIDSDEVSVAVQIKTQTSTRSFANLNTGIFNLNAELQLAKIPAQVTLVLSGPKARLSAFTPDTTAVQADFTDIRYPGVYTVPLRVNVPDSFSVVSITPVSLEIELAEKDAAVFLPAPSARVPQ